MKNWTISSWMVSIISQIDSPNKISQVKCTGVIKKCTNTYLFKSIWTQLSLAVAFPSLEPDEFGPMSEQFGLNVASSMAIVESKLLHVNRISVRSHPHSSTTSVKLHESYITSANIFNLIFWLKSSLTEIIMDVNERS